MLIEREIREQLAFYARMLWERGLVGAFEGNLSARIDETRILVSPANVHKCLLEAASFVTVDIRRGWTSGGTPTSELPLHATVYLAREDVFSVIHAHPPTATGFGIAGETFPMGISTEADTVLGEVVLVPYAPPGSERLAEQLKPYLSDYNVMLLAHHGAITLGSNIPEAYNRMETLERCAKMVIAARALGRTLAIPKGQQ